MSEQLDKFEMYFEVDVPTPYKRKQKEMAVKHLTDQLLRNGCKSVTTRDSYYIDRKSAESLHSFVLVLEVVAPILVVTASVLAIRRELKNANNKGSVFLKDSDGKYIKIDEGMTADDARKKLDETKTD